MRKLKTSNKTLFSLTAVSLFILSFIISAQAASSIIVSYHLHKGTTVNGDLTSVWYQNDGRTLDIRLRRRGWLNYFYELDADFLVTVAKYNYIKWDFDHNLGSALIKISVYYRDNTHTIVALDSPGELYSRGMKQRLGLAQAFAGEPKIVFLDEPLSNIDPLGREEFIKKIRMKREEGITIIISSHIVLEIEQIADYITFIDDGKIKASDKIYNLAQFYGFNEYEITRIDHNESITPKELNELLYNEKDIISDEPKVLREKIIFRTDNPEKVNKILLNYKDFNFTPISGTLNKLYKKIIQGESFEKRE